uniref:Uncharacterized protein n=1 Tax=Sphaerodactylus townsendi TaxID=933632 RepID=A0ACB8FPP3_9SAUR
MMKDCAAQWAIPLLLAGALELIDFDVFMAKMEVTFGDFQKIRYIIFTFSETKRPDFRTAKQMQVEAIDGWPPKPGPVVQETALLTMVVLGHAETIPFDITQIPWYPLVLGMSWLEAQNPFTGEHRSCLP